MAAAAALGLTILVVALARVFARAPRLQEAELVPAALPQTSLTVVVPAYNEAANIGPCLASLLSSEPHCSDWRVLVVDDRSTDATAALAQATADACPASTAGFALLDAGPRPAGERWVGKNWACSQAM